MIENLHEQLAASVERMKQKFPNGEVQAGFTVQWGKKDWSRTEFAAREQFCVGVASSPSVSHEYGFGATIEEAEEALLKLVSPEKLRSKITQLREQAEILERALRDEVAA